jgi:hypothetical protein
VRALAVDGKVYLSPLTMRDLQLAISVLEYAGVSLEPDGRGTIEVVIDPRLARLEKS